MFEVKTVVFGYLTTAKQAFESTIRLTMQIGSECEFENFCGKNNELASKWVNMKRSHGMNGSRKKYISKECLILVDSL